MIDGYQHTRIGLAQHIPHLRSAKTCINRDQDRANLGYSKQNVQPLGAVCEPQGYLVPGLNTALHQPPCCSVTVSLELLKTPPLPCKDQCFARATTLYQTV